MPSAYGGDDFIRVGGPDERFWSRIVLFQEAVDRSLQIEDRMEHATFQSPFGERGEEPLHGVEPRARSWRKVECKPLMAVEALADLWTLVRCVVVEDHMNLLARRDLRLDGV